MYGWAVKTLQKNMVSRIRWSNFLSVFLLLVTGVIGSYAQVVLQPLHFDPNRSNTSNSVSTGRIASHDTLELPFFDDFSSYTGNPDSRRWSTSGGTLVNRRFAIDPPSVGVVTFDGLQSTGDAYGFGFNQSRPCDSLLSKPLFMGSWSPLDSVYLIFFWQSEGLGEAPNANDNDSLYVQLLNGNGQWTTVWSTMGRPLQPFRYAAIPITDVSYFYDGFRFLFSAVGNPSGAFDTWNVDYVLLGPSRTLSDSTFNDLTVSALKGRLLKRYSSMPAEHFAANPLQELNDSITVLVNNLDNTNLNYTLRSLIKAKDACSFTDTLKVDNGNLVRETNGNAFPIAINKQAVQAGDSCCTSLQFFLDSIAVVNTIIQNDTLTETTCFADYLAYDDGTAEYGMGIVNAQNGRFAVRFDLPRSDTLTDIDMHFVRLGRNNQGAPFDLMVWRNLSNDTADILFRRSVSIQYSDTLNTFTRYSLGRALPVPATFYVGWLQFSTEFLNLGADRNNRFNDRNFGNTNGVWRVFEERRDVAPMLRPVFRDPATIGFRDEGIPEVLVDLYPNPAATEVYLSANALRYHITDFTGRTLLKETFVTEQEAISLRHLQPGIYLMHIQTAKGTAVKKLIIQR